MYRCGQWNTLRVHSKVGGNISRHSAVNVEDQQQKVLEATAWDIKIICFLEL